MYLVYDKAGFTWIDRVQFINWPTIRVTKKQKHENFQVDIEGWWTRDNLQRLLTVDCEVAYLVVDLAGS